MERVQIRRACRWKSYPTRQGTERLVQISGYNRLQVLKTRMADVTLGTTSKLPVDQTLNQTPWRQRVFLQLDFSIHDDRVRLEHNLAGLSSTKHIAVRVRVRE